MNSASCSIVGLRKTGAVSRMKSFQNCPGASSTSGDGPSRISRSSNPRASSVPANDSSTMNTTRWPRAFSCSPIPTQLFVGPNAPSGKNTTVFDTSPPGRGTGGPPPDAGGPPEEVRLDRGGRRLGLRVALPDGVPVDHVPDRGQVVGPAVLVLQVVGVLPHVDAEQRCLALEDRRVLVGGAGHLELAAVEQEP